MRWLIPVFLLLLLAIPIAMAIDLNQPLDPADQAKFDEIIQPVMKIYNFIKYIASAIAVICLLFAGITYMTSGSDPRKRENAKSMATYVVIGLLVIWAAPLIVEFMIG